LLILWKGQFQVLRAWGIGFGILFAVDIIWFISMQFKMFTMVFYYVGQIVPIVAAGISAHFAPRKKVLIGMSMAIPATIIMISLAVISQAFGNDIDFEGLNINDRMIITLITFIYSIIICTLGTVGGLVSAGRAHARQNN
jgi:hypothetical protein